MCLAVPAEVVELLGEGQARVRIGATTQVVSTALLDEVAVGEYVIVHVGFALTKLDADKAAQTLALMAEWSEEVRSGLALSR
jgi:hydrogenase expression/formation protein HypC